MITYLEREKRTDNSTASQSALLSEVEVSIMPLLKMLKMLDSDPAQNARLIDTLETNIQNLKQSFGRTTRLVLVHQHLSPVETVVDSMVKQGLTTQKIAENLNISQASVKNLRRRIRKKLALL
jgi:DNA-binding CsgD family transcriptional regulator